MSKARSVFLYFERIPCEFGLDIELSISVLFIQYFWTGITQQLYKEYTGDILHKR